MSESVEKKKEDKHSKLGWGKAQELASELIKTGKLDREAHLATFDTFLKSSILQDQMMALALLLEFIRKYPDFDIEITLGRLFEIGEILCEDHWKNFGGEVLYAILKARGVPSFWIDKVADESSTNFRAALAYAVYRISQLKGMPLERTLGILLYLIDDPDEKVQKYVSNAITEAASRDIDMAVSFIYKFSKGAGVSRQALFDDVKQKIGWHENSYSKKYDQIS